MFFVSHLYKSGFSYSTVNCYLSGISFFHKLNGWEDYTHCFVIRKMADGAKRSNSKADTRLPITRQLLEKIIRILPSLCNSHYELKLFTAAFSLAFHGLFRIGEFAAGNKNISDHSVQLCNVKVFNKFIEVYLGTSTTDQLGAGQVVRISCQENKIVCPVYTLGKFLAVRPLQQGPLFCHFDFSPLTRYQFAAVLKKSLTVLGCQTSCYKSHSFRIGMVASLSMEGYSDDQINIMGRWKSDSYLKYIRIPV